MQRLRATLGISLRRQPIGRRAFIGLGIVSLAALGTAGYAVQRITSAPIPGVRPQTYPATLVPQSSAPRVQWTYSIGADALGLYGTNLIANPSGLYGACGTFVFALEPTNGRLRWQRPGPFAQGTPALRADTLAVLGEMIGDNQTLYLFELNLEDGSERRHVTIEQTPTATVGVSTMCIVPSGADVVMQYDKWLAALDDVSGRFLWQRRLVSSAGSPAIPTIAVVTAPAVAHSVIYAGLTDGNVYAYDLATGALKWTWTPFASTTAAIQSTPLVIDDVLYFGRNDGNVYAIDTNTHQLVWQQGLLSPSDGTIIAAPTSVNGVIYLAGGSLGVSGDSLWALGAKTGRILWQVHPSQVVRNGQLIAYPITSQPTILGNTVYVTAKLAATQATSIDVLYALDTGDGNVRWHLETIGHGTVNDTPPLLPSSPVLLDQVVYFASSAGTVYALSLTS